MFVGEVDKWTLILGRRVHRDIQKCLRLQPLSGMHHVHILIHREVCGHLQLLSLDVQLRGIPCRDRGHLLLIRLEVQLGSISSSLILTRLEVQLGLTISLLLIRLEVQLGSISSSLILTSLEVQAMCSSRSTTT
jgi:hypothetical protein